MLLGRPQSLTATASTIVLLLAAIKQTGAIPTTHNLESRQSLPFIAPSVYTIKKKQPDDLIVPGKVDIQYAIGNADLTYEQVLVFDNIPTEIETCILGWAEPGSAYMPSKIDWLVSGNTHFFATMMTGVPTKVTWNSVNQFTPSDDTAPKFGFSVLTPTQKLGMMINLGSVPCKLRKSIALRINVDYAHGSGQVVSPQTTRSGYPTGHGFYLTWPV